MTFGPSAHQNPQDHFELYEDFVCPIATATPRFKDWLITVSVGTVTSPNPLQQGRPGLVALTGGVLATQFASIATAPFLFGVPAGDTQLLFSHYQVQAAAATADQRLGIGLTPGAAGELASGIFFRAVGIGNWFAVCRNGGAETVVDTGVAQVTQTWHKFLIDVNTARSVRFNVDGAHVATITTNLPAAGVLMNVFAKLDSTGAAAAEQMWLDYVWMRVSGLVR